MVLFGFVGLPATQPAVKPFEKPEDIEVFESSPRVPIDPVRLGVAHLKRIWGPHPREVFADAITDRASGIILAHNHPEGGVEPSEADADVTRRIKQAGEIVGIHLLDHIIFNPSGYFSFLEAGNL
jgi:hypothetical protein